MNESLDIIRFQLFTVRKCFPNTILFVDLNFIVHSHASMFFDGLPQFFPNTIHLEDIVFLVL